MKLDYNSLSQEYARHRQIHPGVFQNLVEAGGLGPASKVLEVGCGTGNYTVALKETIHSSCRGLDPSEGMLARARERTRYVDVKTGRAEQLNNRQNSLTWFSPWMSSIMCDRPAFFGGLLGAEGGRQSLHGDRL